MKRLFDYMPLIVLGTIFVLMGGCIHEVNEEQRRQDIITAQQAEGQKRIADNTKLVQRIINIPIYSLQFTNEVSGQFNGSVEGSFFLGCGDIAGHSNGSMGETSYYYFYKDDGRGGIILSKVNAESTSLKKTTGVPHLETVISVVQIFNTDRPEGSSPKIISQTLYVPVNYKLLGEFKK